MHKGMFYLKDVCMNVYGCKVLFVLIVALVIDNQIITSILVLAVVLSETSFL